MYIEKTNREILENQALTSGLRLDDLIENHYYPMFEKSRFYSHNRPLEIDDFNNFLKYFFDQGDVATIREMTQKGSESAVRLE